MGKPVTLGFRVKGDECPKVDMNLIANAVLTGTDGVFLKAGALNSKETIELLKNVDVVCREAESARWQKEVSNELSYKVFITYYCSTNFNFLKPIILNKFEVIKNISLHRNRYQNL